MRPWWSKGLLHRVSPTLVILANPAKICVFLSAQEFVAIQHYPWAVFCLPLHPALYRVFHRNSLARSTVPGHRVFDE